MEKIKHIHGDMLIQALSKKYRLYLCGNLELPQNELDCFSDDNLEIGISCHDKFTADVPHFHTHATEYIYIIQGAVKIFLINENKEYVFEKDSFFVLQPNSPYASKNKAGTQTLFVKCPGGNDKQTVDVDTNLMQWLSTWDVL